MTETFISIGGDPMPANLQPPQSDLQGAFRKSTDGKRIVIDMPAARLIARDMIRQSRQAMFDRNDAATIRAMQSGDTVALAATKTRGDQLRAAPQDPRLENALTPDDLLDTVQAIISELNQ